MKKTASIWILVIAVMLTIIFNSILFYTFRCNTDYIQSTNYKGKTQSIAKKDLEEQLLIMKLLPQDKSKAYADLTDALSTYHYYEEDEFYRKAKAFSVDNLEAVRKLYSQGKKYDNMRKNMAENIESLAQIGIFWHESYDEELAIVARDFYGLSTLDIPILHDSGINVFINHKITDYLAIALSILSGIFISYRQKKIVSTNIRKSHSALVSSLLLVLFGAISMYVLNAYFVHRYLYAYDLKTLIQSYSAFHSCPTPMNLTAFLIRFVAAKLVACLLAYLATVIICMLDGKRKIIATFATIVFLGTEFILTKLPKDDGILLALKEINIFSLITYERFYETYKNIKLLGMNIHRLDIFVAAVSLLLLATILATRHIVSRYMNEILEKLQYSYFEEINQKYTETRQLWHDFHNHLLAIQELIRKEQFAQANSYMNELEEEMDNSHILTKTGMEALDALIFQKSEYAIKNGIKLDISINALVSEPEFKAVAVCCVVGNLLDNCIEAVMKLPENLKTVSFAIEKRGDMLYISSDNPYVGEISTEGGAFKTTKPDKLSHGWGLKGVSNICKRNGGSMLVDTKEGHFKVQALLMAKIN